ncbi:cation-transporting ATPase [candidate division WWE3 bacterium CG10_big_fil_rev_8_21_14_0_10_39_14]|nr:MAG: cation-transporting ATPase [candidate division WWE3 bacterium CG10_big_fil_rev_8_21_14_0_10_39_14]
MDTLKTGLSSKEVLSLQNFYGQNKIEDAQSFWWHILLRQFKSPFIYLLIAASLISFGLKDAINGLMILLFVFIDVGLGFYQEYKSEKILRHLKKFIASFSKVLRDGKKAIVNCNHLVPGDIVYLETGDVVSADIKILEEENLMMDESLLTGESVFVRKQASTPHNNFNLCFSGTTVISGKGTGVVVKIGKETALGKIAYLSIETHRESDFEKSITSLSSFVLKLILSTLILIFAINLVIKGHSANFPQLLIFSIALAVSVIPEALPAVMTFSLSKGAFKLAKNSVVVKRLSAIEDLGSVEVLCSDKTGTLTENTLTVLNVFSAGDKKETLIFSSLNTGMFEQAVSKVLSAKDFESVDIVDFMPFDPQKRRSSLIVKTTSGSVLYVRGAYEEIIKLCTSVSTAEKKRIEKWVEKEGLRGSRIIAVAKKKVKEDLRCAELTEGGLSLVGLAAFFDPVKKTADSTVKKAQKLGVGIKILTGDSKDVAFAVGKEIGLVKDRAEVITGEDFANMSYSKRAKVVLQYSVFARIVPEQKFEIIELLQKKFVVGFLGEGINDAPALKAANVGLVVQGAADVAQEAADIVLLKKDLGVIINGIQDGRETFANTTKYIKATLASNFGNFYTVAIVSLFIDFLPLLPLQILLLNLLSDFPMVSIATDSVDKEELKSPRKYDIKDIALIGTILGTVSSFFDFLFFLVFYKISPAVLQTNWFMGSVITELLFLFSIRTRKSIFKAGAPSTAIVILTVAAILITVTLPFTAVGQSLFKFEPPKMNYLIIMGVIVVFYLVSTEFVKNLYYKKFNKT